jgi:hypothetical protein
MMPIFEIETPQGKFQVEAPDEQAAIQALQPPAPQAAPQQSAQPERPSWLPSLSAATDASAAGLMFGFDDEIGAGMMAPIEAAKDWYQGRGFDIGSAYTRGQQERDAVKAQRRQDRPVASIAGELAGGLATGGGLGKAGLSLASRPLSMAGKVGAGAVEGAGYGALYGAGEAKPGERLEGAGTGAAIGGVTGGAVGAVGGALANRAARKAAPVAPPTSDDLAATSSALYRASEAQGVAFKPEATRKLANNLKVAAGQINDKIRPLTAGTVDDVDKMLSGQMTLKQIDEFRQGLGMDIKAAQGQDKMFLERMKGIVDNFLDNASPADMTGGPQGVEFLKSARTMWARSKKAETVEKILDMADVKTGQYTQSGLANAIKTEMRALYKEIQKGKAQGWTREEIALIRQMARGGSPNAVVNLLSKFAPRGVVSFGAGQLVGSMLPGAGNLMLPIGGEVAARAADRGAMQAAQALRAAAATGQAPAAIPRLPNRGFPFIPGTSAASMGTGPSLVGSR